jgi:hypothetical protein
MSLRLIKIKKAYRWQACIMYTPTQLTLWGRYDEGVCLTFLTWCKGKLQKHNSQKEKMFTLGHG